jgi:hypothetical protein
MFAAVANCGQMNNQLSIHGDKNQHIIGSMELKRFAYG